jgi:hypothetical protein
VLFGRFRVCDSVEVKQVGPLELRVLHSRMGEWEHGRRIQLRIACFGA